MMRFGRCAAGALYVFTGMVAGVTMMLGAQPEPAFGATVTMTGVVPTVCESSFSRVPVATGDTRVELGLMARRCNDGEGFRVVLHHGADLPAGVIVIGARRVPLSNTGETILFDSDEPERASEPAFLEFATPVSAGTIAMRVTTAPKGVIY